MSFKARDLNVIGYASGFTLWRYVSEDDTLDGMLLQGYFNEVNGMLRASDFMFINAVVNQYAADNAIFVVKNVSDGGVVVGSLGIV